MFRALAFRQSLWRRANARNVRPCNYHVITWSGSTSKLFWVICLRKGGKQFFFNAKIEPRQHVIEPSPSGFRFWLSNQIGGNSSRSRRVDGSFVRSKLRHNVMHFADPNRNSQARWMSGKVFPISSYSFNQDINSLRCFPCISYNFSYEKLMLNQTISASQYLSFSPPVLLEN